MTDESYYEWLSDMMLAEWEHQQIIRLVNDEERFAFLRERMRKIRESVLGPRWPFQ